MVSAECLTHRSNCLSPWVRPVLIKQLDTSCLLEGRNRRSSWKTTPVGPCSPLPAITLRSSFRIHEWPAPASDTPMSHLTLKLPIAHSQGPIDTHRNRHSRRLTTHSKLRLAYEVTGAGVCGVAHTRTVLGRHFHVNRPPQRRPGCDPTSKKCQTEERFPVSNRLTYPSHCFWYWRAFEIHSM